MAKRSERTCEIIRFYRDETRPPKILRKAATLEEAKEHCRSPYTSTDKYFDGYRDKSDDAP